MALGIYKPGQGYWARVLTAAGAMALAAGCAQWVVSNWFHDHSKNVVGTVWGIALGGTAVALWIVLNLPRVVDFMIATETEMKKVSWPDRKTLVTMTGVVISGLLLLALLVVGIDQAFRHIFQWIGIL